MALTSRAGRTLVLNWRCGVILRLPRGEATHLQILAAFGLKPAELPCSGVAFRNTMKFDLRRCVPIILNAYGWAGIAARRQRELEAIRAKTKRKREADRIAADRLAKLRHWLARVYNIGSFDAFLGMLAHHRLEPPPLYKAYVTHTLRTGGPELSAVIEELTLVLNRMARHRELRAALVGSGLNAAQIDFTLWNSYETGGLVTETGVGMVKRMRCEPWDADFFKGPLCLKI